MSSDFNTIDSFVFERSTDLSKATNIGLFDKNVLINYLVSQLSDNFANLAGTDLEPYISQLESLEFNFKTISGSLDMSGFTSTSLNVTANNVLYKGVPLNVPDGFEASQKM